MNKTQKKPIELTTPITDEEILGLEVGDKVYLSGYILCGRDGVLPKIVRKYKEGSLGDLGIDFQGQVIFHTAVSVAGVGPTSSNKLEIESSIAPLSKAGIKIHLGKGELDKMTIDALSRYNSIYAIIPPVTALLGSKTSEVEVVGFPELGMEALHLIKVDKYPMIIGAAHGRSIYG